MPDCPKCGSGILKPDVVFFGDNVPLNRVARVRREVAMADRLLGEKQQESNSECPQHFCYLQSSDQVSSCFRPSDLLTKPGMQAYP